MFVFVCDMLRHKQNVLNIFHWWKPMKEFFTTGIYVFYACFSSCHFFTPTKTIGLFCANATNMNELELKLNRNLLLWIYEFADNVMWSTMKWSVSAGSMYRFFIYIVLFYRWNRKVIIVLGKNTHHITIYWWWFGSESDSWTVESKVKQCSGL